MYYIYVTSGPSLLIESTDSMIPVYYHYGIHDLHNTRDMQGTVWGELELTSIYCMALQPAHTL